MQATQGYSSPEAGEASGHVEPRVRCEVLTLTGILRSQISKDRWMEVSVEAGHRPFGPGLGRHKDRIEPFAEGHGLMQVSARLR